MTTRQPSRHAAGFSLIELVIVVVIIGIIGAIAIPRLSRGAAGANQSKLKQDLAVMNKALDLYAAEHGGMFPKPADIEQNLTWYTDMWGSVSRTQDAKHYLGPYLRSIPPAPGGANPGATGIAAKDGPGVGWIYDSANGRIHLNRGTAINVQAEDEALNRVIDGLGL